jgi:hypothetical protein
MQRGTEIVESGDRNAKIQNQKRKTENDERRSGKGKMHMQKK